jgi:hypothetical protein
MRIVWWRTLHKREALRRRLKEHQATDNQTDTPKTIIKYYYEFYLLLFQNYFLTTTRNNCVVCRQRGHPGFWLHRITQSNISQITIVTSWIAMITTAALGCYIAPPYLEWDMTCGDSCRRVYIHPRNIQKPGRSSTARIKTHFRGALENGQEVESLNKTRREREIKIGGCT